jgi:hypothetical protein
MKKTLPSLIFAGALLLGACSSTRSVATTDDYGAVKVDSEGRVVTTDANLIPDSTGTIAPVTQATVTPTSGTIVAQSNIIAEPVPDLVITETTSMTSSSQVDPTSAADQSKTTSTTTTRTRIRKD